MGKSRQLTFTDHRMRTGRGGPRPGAGRPAANRPVVHHVKRDEVSEREPAHVTIRVLDDVPSLRRKSLLRAFQRSLREVRGRPDFRVVEYSVQIDHVHLIVEAADKGALACGMKAVGSRLAKAVHRVFGRAGRVLAGRYHVRALKGPKEVRNALAYVLLNVRSIGASAMGRRRLCESTPPPRDGCSAGGAGELLWMRWSRV